MSETPVCRHGHNFAEFVVFLFVTTGAAAEGTFTYLR